MATKNVRSIEEQVEDWCKTQLRSIKYYTKTESINSEIEEALRKAPSKSGGEGANYPDIKCFLETSDMRRIPVMIEVKGRKGDLIKCDKNGDICNLNKDKEPHYGNIAKYAVNGAVHYAHAILNNTESYKEVVAIGVNGYDTSIGRIYEMGVYYVSKENLFVPKKVGEYTDLSFLLPEYVNGFIKDIDKLFLTDSEIELKKIELEDDIERRLKVINQKMHDEDYGQKIDVGQRVQLITGLVMAGLGVPGKVSPLSVSDLRGDQGEKNNDGQVIMNKISDYLSEKQLPRQKIEMIEEVLRVVFIHSKLQEPKDGESALHTIYADVRQNIIPFLTGELHNIDFTGRLFNVLNEWVDVPDGAKNDVVLTPRYITELMARLCGVNMDSYVWDFATGSAGFLISSMHQMIADAKQKISSPEELNRKITHIKMYQLLGIEKLADIYMLAVLNMILMKDGSSNIIHGDSLTEFEGNYEQGEYNGKPFPANVFLLNPPYSKSGKGFVFVHRALSMMHHGGMAAVLIMENAGSGNGLPYTREILKNNTLVASIHMSDIFCGKASVQTAIYVFKVGAPHDIHQVVKFIDFSNDGYTRQNRKKSSQSVNLRNTDHATERYDEVVRLIRYGRGAHDENLQYYQDCYVEDYITLDGNDWTYAQHRNVDVRPVAEDFQRVVKDYLAWQIGEIIRNDNVHEESLDTNYEDCTLTDDEAEALRRINEGKVKMKEVSIVDFFDVRNSHNILKSDIILGSGNTPYVTASEGNNSIVSYVSYDDEMKEEGNSIMIGGKTLVITYQPKDFFSNDSHNLVLRFNDENGRTENIQLFFVAALYKSLSHKYSWGNSISNKKIQTDTVLLPVASSSTFDYTLMETYIRALKKNLIGCLLNKLHANGKMKK